MNKRIIILALAVTILSNIMSYGSEHLTSRLDTIMQQMSEITADFDNLDNADRYYRLARKEYFKAMHAVDYQLKIEQATKLWENLDTVTASASDYRRLGQVLLGCGENELANWCFKKGAIAGDAYCYNRYFIATLKKTQDPSIALTFIANLNARDVTPQLSHNLALALSKIKNPPIPSLTVLQMAESFLMVEKMMQQDGYEWKFVTGDFIDYRPDLEAYGKTWDNPSVPKLIGSALWSYIYDVIDDDE